MFREAGSVHGHNWLDSTVGKNQCHVSRNSDETRQLSLNLRNEPSQNEPHRLVISDYLFGRKMEPNPPNDDPYKETAAAASRHDCSPNGVIGTIAADVTYPPHLPAVFTGEPTPENTAQLQSTTTSWIDQELF